MLDLDKSPSGHLGSNLQFNASIDPTGRRQYLIELGERYCQEHSLKDDVFIGYGNQRLANGHDPWGMPCHVAVVSFDSGGANPMILAAGKPILGNDWIPLVQTWDKQEEGYSFGNTFTDFLTIGHAAASGRLLVRAERLSHSNVNYAEWIGFLRSLQRDAG